MLSVSQFDSGRLANKDEQQPSLKRDVKGGEVFLANKNLTGKGMAHFFILILKFICF